MKDFSREFYNCIDCGSNKFIEQPVKVLYLDEDGQYNADYKKLKAVPYTEGIRYVCADCGKELERMPKSEYIEYRLAMAEKEDKEVEEEVED